MNESADKPRKWMYKRRDKQMKSTGITRQVDELGRFVLPIEIRRMMGIKEKDALEIFTEDNRIILRKYEPTCTFCKNADHLVIFADKRICPECLQKLHEL